MRDLFIAVSMLTLVIVTIANSGASASAPFDPFTATCAEYQSRLDDYCQGGGFSYAYVQSCDDSLASDPALTVLDVPANIVECVP